MSKTYGNLFKVIVLGKHSSLFTYEIYRKHLIFVGEESRLAINDIIEELQNIKSQSRSNERKACMTQLIRMSRDGQITVIQDNFRYSIIVETVQAIKI